MLTFQPGGKKLLSYIPDATQFYTIMRQLRDHNTVNTVWFCLYRLMTM